MMHLYGVSLSPFVERVMITLDCKGALDKVRRSQPPGGIHSDQHYEQNPMGKIPYLVLDDGTLLVEGQVIAEYLDSQFDGPSVFPTDPVARARANMIARIYDTHVIRALAPILMAAIWKQPDEAAIKKSVEQGIPNALNDLEAIIDGEGYAIGDGFTIADAALVPLVFQLKAFGPAFGVEGFGDRPKLAKWMDTAFKHELAQNSMARIQRVVEKMAASQAAE